MVDLRYNRLMFIQFLGKSEARKLTAMRRLALMSSAVISTLAMATPRHVVFLDLSWNLTLDWRSRTLAATSSLAPSTEGNFPALLRPGPNKRGILRIKVEEARKA